jgi:hypothetical protein
MDFQSLKTTLANPQATELIFVLDSGEQLASHYHVTEVGKVVKDFVDCGGVRRTSETCVLQTLVAGDTEHRLAPAKFLKILQLSADLGIGEQTEVEVEIQGQTIETYAIAQATSEGSRLVFHLAAKQTACLAEDQCGLPVLAEVSQGCCGGSGAC